MHYHAEIIMPPTTDVEAAVTEILAQFDENQEDNEDYSTKHAFWDWWQIGGRYSGSKVEALVSKEKRDAFFAALADLKVTVSGLVWGKQELSPASQIPAVDALWREMCPGSGDVCPAFKHSGDSMAMDVCRLADLPASLSAYTLIVAGPGYQDKLQAQHLAHQSIWNGVTHQDTTWKGNVSEALAEWREKSKSYRDDYREKITPRDDWLVVTVDYHS
jgi:hypothetical protein